MSQVSVSPFRPSTPTFSSSFVPRSASAIPPRPASLPQKPTSSSFVPRSTSIPRASDYSRPPTPRLDSFGSVGGGHNAKATGSGLRNEVRKSSKPALSTEDVQAEIRKLLDSLPPPLPPSLPPKYTSSPNASGSKPAFTSFLDYAQSRSPLKRKRAPEVAGLGLNLEDGRMKKRLSIGPSPLKTPKSGAMEMARSSSAGSLGPQNGRGTTPTERGGSVSPQLGSSVGPIRRESIGRSGLRHEMGGGKETWSREMWREAAADYFQRATMVKRHGTSLREASAASSHTANDRVKGILFQTDAVLLYTFSFFCHEQQGDKKGYEESAPLRKIVQAAWEREIRNVNPDIKDLAKGMLGLLHLVEAVWVYQISQHRISQLSRRSKELASPTSSHPLTGPSPVSNTSSPPAGTGPSPAAQSSSSSSADPPNSATKPNADIQNLIRNVSNLSSSATTHLQTSRHYLPLSLLRSRFPNTFERAITSDLGDEALPAPGDTLGNARNVDVDDPDTKWAWPIELGMCCPLAHVSAFGRSLVEEFASSQGWAWQRKWAP